MPYALQSSAESTGKLDLATAVSTSGAVGSKSWTIEFNMQATGDFGVVPLGGGGFILVAPLTGDHTITSRVDGYTDIALDTGVDTFLEHTYKIVALNGSKEFFVDDVSVGVSTVQSDAGGYHNVCFEYGGDKRHGIVKYINATDHLDATNNLELLNTTGTGNVWPDISGNGNDATQYSAWPADDSEWVFYSAPSTVATPINLAITNLLTTSARLTWEQG